MKPKDESVSLKEYFERILLEKDKAVNIALNSAKEAVEIAQKNADKWRDNANEWRQAMNDREAKFTPMDVFNQYKESAEKAATLEKERNDKNEGKNEGYGKLFAWILAAAATVIAIISLILRFN